MADERTSPEPDRAAGPAGDADRYPTTTDTAPIEPEVTPVADPSDVTIEPEPGAAGGDSADEAPAPPGQDAPPADATTAAGEPAPAAIAPQAATDTPAAADDTAAADSAADTDAPAAEDPGAAHPDTTGTPAGPDEHVEPGGDAPIPPPAGAPPAPEQGRDGPRQRRPRSRRPRPGGDRPRGPRPKVPLPFDDLRAASGALLEQFGPRKAVRDAFGVLGGKERRDLSQLVSEDGEWRTRARNIAAGSLGAGRVGKALAAQQISMAPDEEVWRVALTKEEADQRLARIRDARQRDERRAQRDRERAERTDRISREDLAKARDGRVGAQIRIVQGGTGRDDRRREGGEGKKPPKPSVLDRLGY